MMSKLVTTSFSENLRRAEKLGLVRTPKQAEKAAPAVKPAARQAEELGKQAADVYDKAVGLAGRAQGTVPGRQAKQIAERMIAGALSRGKG